MRNSASKSLNLAEEYKSTLRTKSYADLFTKAQTIVNEPSFPSNSSNKFSEFLLEPAQESIPDILESGILSKLPELKDLMLTYFHLSAEASRICSHLLNKINQIQYHDEIIHQVLDTIDDYSPEDVHFLVSELSLRFFQINPLSSPDRHDFRLIKDKYSLVVIRLKAKRKKVSRKIRLFTAIRGATGICIITACGLIAITAIIVAAHTLTALVLGAVVFSFPMKWFHEKSLSFRFLRTEFLRKVGQQLDVAAKGTYTLNRHFDTISRLVARLHDEVEHKKAKIQFCMERKEDRFSLQVVKELKNSSIGFRKQVKELEEHVYLCLVTINRARAIIIKEMT